MSQMKVSEELELILNLLPETQCGWHLWAADATEILLCLGPFGLWHWPLMLEHGEDAQVENSEMLPFMAETDNNRA